jgi:methionyl-tRNA formyltransferase
MKIIFFGTPDYVLPVLEALHKAYDSPREQSLIAVVTQPPRPVGRKQFMTYSAVDNWAHTKKGIAIIREFELDKFPEADLGIVASYGKIIPEAIIKKFKFGILNIHPSLLPKYRGASPTQAAILNGDEETGVSVIKMDAKMDHGPVISKFTERIEGTDTNEILRKRLFEKSAQFLIDLIPNYLKNKIRLKEQDHEEATFTKILAKEDGFIEPKKLADAIAGKGFIEVDRLIRAMQPWPGVYTLLRLVASEGQAKTKRLKILRVHVQFEKLILDEVQLEGKDPVSWEQFRQGHAGLF